jgi:hypothetical protein
METDTSFAFYLSGIGLFLGFLLLMPLIFWWVFRTRGARLRRRNKVECGFRVLAGVEPGLGPQWVHGTAEIHPGGRLVFTGTRGGVRFLKRPPIGLTILVVDHPLGRQPGLGEAFSVSPVTRVLPVRTATAGLEWAMLPSQTAWAVGQVTGRPALP